MKPIIVLGMHRSGTSAVTRAIGLLGAAMGDDKQLHKHHENVALRRVNRTLLEVGDGTWDAPPDRGWWDAAPARALLDRARGVVARQFGAADIAVWKDPRTCLTLPFWLDVFDEAPVFLLIHRHPTEVADSLTSRNHLTREHGYALWERYNADAVEFASGRPTVVIDYDTLVAEPEQSLTAINAAFNDFGVVLPNDPATTEHGLVAQERHHTADDRDALDADVATASQAALFGTLRELRGAHAKFTLPDGVPAPDPRLSALFEGVRAQKQERAARKAARTAGD